MTSYMMLLVCFLLVSHHLAHFQHGSCKPQRHTDYLTRDRLLKIEMTLSRIAKVGELSAGGRRQRLTSTSTTTLVVPCRRRVAYSFPY